MFQLPPCPRARRPLFSPVCFRFVPCCAAFIALHTSGQTCTCSLIQPLPVELSCKSINPAFHDKGFNVWQRFYDKIVTNLHWNPYIYTDLMNKTANEPTFTFFQLHILQLCQQSFSHSFYPIFLQILIHSASIISVEACTEMNLSTAYWFGVS